MSNRIETLVFTETYSTDNFVEDFVEMFPEFALIKDSEDADVTTACVKANLNLALDTLVQSIVDYYTVEPVKRCLAYMTAHYLQYFDVIDNYDTIKSVLRATSSMGGDGLSVSMVELAKLKNNIFSTRNEFLNTTAYGKVVTVYLDKLAGSAGGSVV